MVRNDYRAFILVFSLSDKFRAYICKLFYLREY